MTPDAHHATTTCMVLLRSHPLCRYFSPIDFDLLKTLIHISLLYKVRSSSGAVYCVPGQTYLAMKCGCHRVTVSRHISGLEDRKFIHATQRRPSNGQWSTNLYRFSKLLWTLIWDVLKKFELAGRRVARPLHIGTDSNRTPSQKLTSSLGTEHLRDETESLDAFLARLSTKIFGTAV